MFDMGDVSHLFVLKVFWLKMDVNVLKEFYCMLSFDNNFLKSSYIDKFFQSFEFYNSYKIQINMIMF